MASRPWIAGTAVLVTMGAALTFPAASATTTPASAPRVSRATAPPVDPDRALGNGLSALLKQSEGKAVPGNPLRVDQNALTVRDAAGRVLVEITPRAGVDHATFRNEVTRAGLKVTVPASSVGTLTGFVPLSAVPKLQGLADTGTLNQVLKPHTNVGSVTSQGVHFQGIDKVLKAGDDGSGLTVGILSDSYDTATTNEATGQPLTDHAAQDVASGDLPGVGNTRYPQPVVVLQDDTDASTTDEGRAMAQIVHDVAPGAKLCFATADTGQQGFADNIRALAAPSGACGANVIVDDVGYADEPMFSDGVIAQAVDDVTKEGVTYLSSAGNSGDTDGWAAPAHIVNARTYAKKAHLDLSAVDPSEYAGGLEDMDPGKGIDVAQDVTLGPAGGVFTVQWNDPLDPNGAKLGDPVFTDAGAITAANPSPTSTFTVAAGSPLLGKEAIFNADGVPSGSTDIVLTLTKPDGTTVGPVDTGTSPEVIGTTINQPGDYTLTIQGYDGSTGPYTVKVQPVLAPSKVTTDFDLLLFSHRGAYLGAVGGDNTLTGSPTEVAALSGVKRLQLVIAKRTVGKTPVTQLRDVIQNNSQANFAEYASPFAPTIYGHPAAAGAIAVGAEDPFRAYLPEAFSSVGGRLPFYFDSAGNRLAKPEYRAKPEITATDGGNTTFFISDTTRDPDSYPNFFGTSAAAPHAAGIVALMLAKRGTMSPQQVKRRLEHSTYQHDLDPFVARGRSHGLTVRAHGTQSAESNTVPGSLADPRFFTVAYHGRVPLRSVTFYGASASPTALRGDHGKLRGLVFDRRPLGKPGDFGTGGFPFTVGSVSHGLSKHSVRASFSDRSGGKGRYRTMTVHFDSRLGSGQSVQFGIDRDDRLYSPSLSTIEGNGADEIGGGVFYPSDRVVKRGMKFRAVRADGSSFVGYVENAIGYGWTPIDGHGLVDARKAVLGH